MHRHRRAHHVAAEGLADRLLAEADAEHRNGRRGLVDQIEADAGLVRRAGAGREHDRVRIGGDHVARGHLVVAMHGDLRPQLAEIVDEVEGEAVVIVDQDNHAPGQGLDAVYEAGEQGVKDGRAETCRGDEPFNAMRQRCVADR